MYNQNKTYDISLNKFLILNYKFYIVIYLAKKFNGKYIIWIELKLKLTLIKPTKRGWEW